MSRLARIIRAVVDFVGRAATGYEPAVTAALVAAFFTMLSGIGLVVGDLPQKVDAVLGFVAFVAPLIAGWYARQKVAPIKTLNESEVLVSDGQVYAFNADTRSSVAINSNRTLHGSIALDTEVDAEQVAEQLRMSEHRYRK
ncbi:MULTISPECIES: hypothetical protein [unclassified Aeromicrobium]|uniref:hypothetical protein n=1 Tax=unclassified Aeromicrobium TaxID=2633570 RepID=UPI002889F91E|nr:MULTISPECIES: hypothetical protein [unclassified Aeromicrobium]